MFKRYRTIKFCSLIFAVFLATSCDRTPREWTYQEIVIPPPSAMNLSQKPSMGVLKQNSLASAMDTQNEEVRKMLKELIAEVQLDWDIPQGWIETKGEGMRLATFHTKDQDPIECSIISLGGIAGGIEANIVRWMRQINLTEVSQEEFNNFLDSQERFATKSGFQITIVDFTQLQLPSDSKAPSMIAAIVMIEDKTVFVKMAGAKAAVSYNREKFRGLCQSLRQS